MKKFFFFLSIAAMGLASCSKNTVSEDTSASNRIGFGVYAGRITKADSTFIPKGQTYLPAGTSFGVYCYSTTADDFETVKTTALPNYMANQEVKFNVTSADATNAANKNNYSYDPTKYWPKKINGTYILNLTFYAYYPYNSSAITTKPSSSTAGLGSFEYTVPAAVDSQPDFMLSELVADQNYESNSGNVPFIFHHVLSQIQVSAKIDDETNRNATVTITGIVFNNLHDHDTVSLGYDGSGNTTYSWGKADGSADYDVSPSSPIVLGTTGTDCTDDGNTILTVPQTFPDDATADITYTVEGNGGTSKTVTISVLLKDIVTEEGKCTNFDFTISLFDATKPITFTAEVVDWVAKDQQTGI